MIPHYFFKSVSSAVQLLIFFSFIHPMFWLHTSFLQCATFAHLFHFVLFSAWFCPSQPSFPPPPPKHHYFSRSSSNITRSHKSFYKNTLLFQKKPSPSSELPQPLSDTLFSSTVDSTWILNSLLSSGRKKKRECKLLMKTCVTLRKKFSRESNYFWLDHQK